MPLIVGLGNPGKEYEGTPHNIGFEVAAQLAARAQLKFRRSPVPNAEEVKLSRAGNVVLLRPLSYKNRSGGPVSAALRYYGFAPADLFVVCDDVNLPLGHLRIRLKGGAGGQKGLLSIIETLGTEEFARLRLGVGGGHPGADITHHVLSKFSGTARTLARVNAERAADAIECYLSDGLAEAMNRFNTQRQITTEPPSGANATPDTPRPKGDPE